MGDLLEAFTKLQAYLGDPLSAEGWYNNTPSVVVRKPKLSKKQILELLPKIKSAIMDNTTDLSTIKEQDIRDKVKKLQSLYETKPEEEQDELIEEIGEYMEQLESEPDNNGNNGNNGNMSGGAKKSSKKRRSTRRKLKTRKANRKNMRKSRSRVARR